MRKRRKEVQVGRKGKVKVGVRASCRLRWFAGYLQQFQPDHKDQLWAWKAPAKTRWNAFPCDRLRPPLQRGNSLGGNLVKSHTESYRLAGGGLKLGPCQVFASHGNCCRRCLLCVDMMCGSRKYTEWISSEGREEEKWSTFRCTHQSHTKLWKDLRQMQNTNFLLPQRLLTGCTGCRPPPTRKRRVKDGLDDGVVSLFIS